MHLLTSLATLAMIAAAPQQGTVAKSGAAKQGEAKSTTRAAAATKKTDVAACRRAHPNYDAKTNTYRDARGKRHRCTR